MLCNIRTRRLHAVSLPAILLCAAFGCIMHAGKAPCPQDKQYTVLFNRFCAPLLQERLRKNIEHFLSDRNPHKISARALAEELQTLYPCVARVRISYHGAGRDRLTNIMIDIHRPCAVINNLFILIKTGEIVPADYYPAHTYEDSFACTVADSVFSRIRSDKDRACKFVRFIENLPPQIGEVYDCYWYDPTMIYCAHKTEPFGLKVDCNTRFDGRLLQAIRLVRSNDAPDRDGRVKRTARNRHMTIDVRCENRLICARQKGGQGNENEKNKKRAE